MYGLQLNKMKCKEHYSYYRYKPVSIESFENDKLPHSATAKSMTEENMSADSSNVEEAENHSK